MAFIVEQKYYEKTIMSDLQGAWEVFLESVITHHPFNSSARVIFHINEAMSWECVRNLDAMKMLSVLIRNIIHKSDAPGEVVDNLHEVIDCLNEALQEIRDGKVL